MAISPSSGTIWLLRGVAYFSLMTFSSVFDDGHHARFFRENVEQILDAFEQFLVFALDLVNFQRGQLIQTQFQNRVHLPLGQRVTARVEPRFAADQNAPALDLFLRPLEREQFHARFLARFGFADDGDEFVEVRQRDEITFEQLGAFFGFLQFKARAAQNDFAAMLDVALDHFLERERLRLAVVNRERVDAERNLQLRVLVKIGDDDLGIAVALEFHHEPRVLVGLVAHRGDFRDDFFVHQLGDFFLKRRAVDVERNFRDDKLLAVAASISSEPTRPRNFTLPLPVVK